MCSKILLSRFHMVRSHRQPFSTPAPDIIGLARRPLGDKEEVVLTSRTKVRYRLETPMCLTRAYWERHRLTHKDLAVILEGCCPKLLWQMVVAHGLEVSTTSVQYFTVEKAHVHFTSKCTALSKLIQHVPRVDFYDRFTKNVCRLQFHNPTVPVYQVAPTIFDNICNLILTEPLGPVRSVRAGFFSLVGCRWVSRGVENNGVRCSRVLPLSEEKRRSRDRTPLWLRCPLVLDQESGGEMWVTSEDIIVNRTSPAVY